MSISPSMVALVLAFAGALGAAQPAAAPIDHEEIPDFLARADAAVAAGNPDRALGLIVPRLGRLHRSAHRHLAYATLCEAHLYHHNFALAGQACARAAQSECANWRDMNNLGTLHYLTGDFTGALGWFARAARARPEREELWANIEAAVAATAR
jgi:tetratricopeptide (TPR) repeat protein